uniref:Protein LTV1 homolog n=1 Tax=Timema monikensis TaxID=170555 RepID=A0A7R9HNI4_9NEOP|nr:unnamed protein product [Timema monikensis]
MQTAVGSNITRVKPEKSDKYLLVEWNQPYSQAPKARGKKKFIDHKNSITFSLVHRSQQDPLVTDETAPQHVLVPTGEKQSKDEIEKRKEEERKFGVFFDDDYNYLNHLFDIRKSAVEWESVEKFQIKRTDITKHEGVKLQLPSSVFASTIEEDVGLLNLAAPRSGPQLDLDPDVVAALDDDFDFDNPDNQLEDDFIQLANTGDNYDDELVKISDSDEERECLDVSSNADSNEEEDDDDVASLTGPQFTFADEETKSRFTNYSLSSSVIRRNDQLSLLDNRFEHMFAGYDDAEIGALDCEEIDGYIPIDSDQVLKCAEEFERERATHKPDTDVTLKRLEQLLSSEDEEEMVRLELKQEDRFDCESILSTYSNLYNHPQLIEEPVIPRRIRISRKTGVPLDVWDSGNTSKLTAKALAKFDASNVVDPNSHDGAESVISMLSTLSIRLKDETPEQRRERKKALKEYRKERRLERKANTLAFKEEKKRQEKIALNNKVNLQSVHIL